MTKETRKYWLNKGSINWIINWKAGLDCFGNKIILQKG
jgi:hypothetical protein